MSATTSTEGADAGGEAEDRSAARPSSSAELDAARALIAIGDHRGARAQLEAVPEDAPQPIDEEARALLERLKPDLAALIVAAVTLLLAVVLLVAVVS